MMSYSREAVWNNSLEVTDASGYGLLFFFQVQVPRYKRFELNELKLLSGSQFRRKEK